MKTTYNRKLKQWVDEVITDDKRIEKLQMIPDQQPNQEDNDIHSEEQPKRNHRKGKRP